LMDRIALRDRSYERSMERDYIAALGRTYDDFFAHYAAAPVLTLDANQIDFVHRADDLRIVVERIRKKLDEGEYQQRLFENGATT
ncbi:MAG TPA: deoxynucleoside kinase, partial [Anaerolineae bacterium]